MKNETSTKSITKSIYINLVQYIPKLMNYPVHLLNLQYTTAIVPLALIWRANV